MECGQDRSKVKCSLGSNTVLWAGLIHVEVKTYKNANQSIQQVQKLGNERRYKTPHRESGLYDNSYAGYSEKRFTPIYKALYGDAML